MGNYNCRASRNDARRSNSGTEEADSVLVKLGLPPEDEIDPDAEARRIAGELVRLHKAGAIKSEKDASFYANLIRRFGASFTVRTGPFAQPGSSQRTHGAGT